MTGDQNPFPRSLSLAVHEFRTPVTVVAGYLRMLLREQGGPLTDKQRKMLEEADRSCTRLGALVGEMSDLGKLESHELSLARHEVDINQILSEMPERVREGADRGVRLEVRAAAKPLIVVGDRVRLSTALTALVHAALRERGDPGIVVAECSMIKDERNWGVVAIGDDSLLSPLRDSRRTPPPFDEWRGGLGLALPVARRIIEAHGGALWSLPGAQSRSASALRLPLREQDTP
jgi:signal transduction histidine kinase